MARSEEGWNQLWVGQTGGAAALGCESSGRLARRGSPTGGETPPQLAAEDGRATISPGFNHAAEGGGEKKGVPNGRIRGFIGAA